MKPGNRSAQAGSGANSRSGENPLEDEAHERFSACGLSFGPRAFLRPERAENRKD